MLEAWSSPDPRADHVSVQVKNISTYWGCDKQKKFQTNDQKTVDTQENS